MQILRHEAGHIVQHAYALHRRRKWQDTFGRSSTPYPESYRPNPNSRNFVQHLPRWYAQSHPDEDFAETFAVWLTPRSNWRQRYAEWPGALAKLEYVDALMGEIAGTKAGLTRRMEVDPVGRLNRTLADHYEQKLAWYAVDTDTRYDKDLQRIFSADPRHAHRPTGLVLHAQQPHAHPRSRLARLRRLPARARQHDRPAGQPRPRAEAAGAGP